MAVGHRSVSHKTVHIQIVFVLGKLIAQVGPSATEAFYMTATIHVVDNDTAVRDSLRLSLEVEGFAVRTYASAASLLEADLPPHGCVLSDVGMPGISGPELECMLVERGVALPFVFMSGQPDAGDTVAGSKTGAILLRKPFQRDDLVDAVRRALRANAEA